MATQRVVVPYLPRRWARKLHNTQKRFAAIVLHRRAGKSTAVINHHQRAALDNTWERKRLQSLVPGLSEKDLNELIHPPGGRHYGHIMPTRVQAKMVAWDKIKFYARPIPGVKFNESELLVRYPTGHKLQLFGADDPDSLRGLAASGVSFDEYSQQPENIFSEILSKALADHLGYAIFLGTIKGKDHLYRTWKAASTSDDWFSLWQDIDTSLATETGATTTALKQAMQDEQRQVLDGIMTQAEYDQEWYLSTDAAIKGAYYQAELGKAKAEHRIGHVPYDPVLPVDTWWDLGIGDSTAIWFVQSLRTGEIRVIDYYESSGEGMAHYASVLRQRGYAYGRHVGPHDIQVRELGSGRTRIETAQSLGLKFEIAPNISIDDGIHATRMILPRCWFDETKTAVGVECLRHYRKRWNASLNEFSETPVHDHFSHGADAFRMGAVSHTGPMQAKRVQRRAPGQTSDQTAGWMRG